MPSIESYFLVAGGSGYIGSHTVLELVQSGFKVVVVDNLSNSVQESLHRVAELAGLSYEIPFHKVDVRDEAALEEIFKMYPIRGVVHFAGLKAVGESVKKPLDYYDNNLTGTISLLKLMKKYDVKKMLFSSSATVYKAEVNSEPFTEDSPLGCTSPYGRTKLFMENIIEDVVRAEEGWSAVMLRYFNPAGAHPSGKIGEDPAQIPNNLMPYVSQVAIGKLEKVHVFGSDYKTRDGTGVRDYIHVMDLAEAHVASLRLMENKPGFHVYNVGSGSGQSVLEMIGEMSKAVGRSIPYVLDDRRPGDMDTIICNPAAAKRDLGFKTHRGLDEMCRDLWSWQTQNPAGYKK